MRTVGLEYIQGHYWPYSFCGTKSIQEKKMDLGELATNFGPTSTLFFSLYLACTVHKQAVVVETVHAQYKYT